MQRLHARPKLRQRQQLLPPLPLSSDHLQLRRNADYVSSCARSMASDSGSGSMDTRACCQGERGGGGNLFDLLSQL